MAWPYHCLVIKCTRILCRVKCTYFLILASYYIHFVDARKPESQVEVRPDCVSSSFLDENVSGVELRVMQFGTVEAVICDDTIHVFTLNVQMSCL